MFLIRAPIIIVPTAEAREALGPRLKEAGLAAYREIAVAAKGLEIAASSVRRRSPDASQVLACPPRWRCRNRAWARRSTATEKLLHRCTVATG